MSARPMLGRHDAALPVHLLVVASLNQGGLAHNPGVASRGLRPTFRPIHQGALPALPALPLEPLPGGF